MTTHFSLKQWRSALRKPLDRKERMLSTCFLVFMVCQRRSVRKQITKVSAARGALFVVHNLILTTGIATVLSVMKLHGQLPKRCLSRMEHGLYLFRVVSL